VFVGLLIMFEDSEDPSHDDAPKVCFSVLGALASCLWPCRCTVCCVVHRGLSRALYTVLHSIYTVFTLKVVHQSATKVLFYYQRTCQTVLCVVLYTGGLSRAL